MTKRLDISAVLGSKRDRGRETMRDLERARRDFRREHPDLLVRTETVVMSPAALRDQVVVDRARDNLAARLQRWVDDAGRQVVEVSWSTDPPIDGTMLSSLRLEASTVERTDGEWPSIHAARREDEADRAAARERAASPVHGPLDALASAADWWADRDLRGL